MHILTIQRNPIKGRYRAVSKKIRRRIIMKDCIVKTGEKPGSGSYNCTNCGTEVSLGKYDKMPPCPKCNNTEFSC